jgi:hypothetical protein
MFGVPTRSLDQMTNREIIAAIVVLTLVCGFLITTSILSAVKTDDWFSIVWNGGGAIFVATILLVCLPPAIRELLRRRRNKIATKERQGIESD